MILDRFRLTGQVAVVTGAGRGIGAGTALALAEAGADVVLSARTSEQLDEVAARVTAAGRTAHVVPADLSDPANAAALAEAAVETFGRLDVVVNNVGGTLPVRCWRRHRNSWRRRSGSTSPPATPSPPRRRPRC